MSEERCNEKILDGSGWHMIRCKRKAVKDGVCKQHHPDSKAARRAKAQRLFDQKMTNSPHRRAADAMAECEDWKSRAEKAEAEVERLLRILNGIVEEMDGSSDEIGAKQIRKLITPT